MGSIPEGSIYYLKGAMRIQTAIAVVVAFHSLGHQAVDSTNEASDSRPCQCVDFACEGAISPSSKPAAD